MSASKGNSKTQGTTKNKKEIESITNIRKSNRVKKLPKKFTDYNPLDIWLEKKYKEGKIIENTTDKSSSVKENLNSNIKNQVNNVAKKKINKEQNVSKTNTVTRIQKNKHLPSKQSKLDNFLQKNKGKKKTFVRSESSDSFELPSFVPKNTKKGTKKSTLKSTVQEILAERKALERDKAALASFKPMSDADLELSFTTTDLYSSVEEAIENLDCREVPTNELKRMFKKNLKHLSGIMKGTIFNTRHSKFYDLNRRQFTSTCEDLTYNTSMIVFKYEQKEFLLNLLAKEFDPDFTKTQYFFQVLLPELCLLIFMEVHNMDRKAALEYLDKRPILPDD